MRRKIVLLGKVCKANWFGLVYRQRTLPTLFSVTARVTACCTVLGAVTLQLRGARGEIGCGFCRVIAQSKPFKTIRSGG